MIKTNFPGKSSEITKMIKFDFFSLILPLSPHKKMRQATDLHRAKNRGETI